MKITLIFFFLFLTVNIIAQKKAGVEKGELKTMKANPYKANKGFKREEKRIPDGKPNLKIGYLSAMIYPGLKVGLEQPVSTSRITWLDSRGITHFKTHEKHITLNFGVYNQAKLHTNYMLWGEWLKRTHFQKGLMIDWSAGLGYSRTYNSEITYLRNKSGGIEKDDWAGHNYLLMNLSGTVGQNVELANGFPFKIYSRLSLNFMYPYTKLPYPRPILEFGTIINLEDF